MTKQKQKINERQTTINVLGGEHSSLLDWLCGEVSGKLWIKIYFEHTFWAGSGFKLSALVEKLLIHYRVWKHDSTFNHRR